MADNSFDPVVVLTDQGIIDASKYRGFTKMLKDKRCQFSTETTVPPDLQ